MKALCLFFTYGIGLADWIDDGSFYREILIYEKLLGYFDRIYFITYGKDDKKYQNLMPENIIILPKKINVPNSLYSLIVPFIYGKEIKKSIWLKTNQMMGSWSAVIAKIICRKKLFTRTGFTQSIFSMKEKGGALKNIVIFIIEYIGFSFANLIGVTSESDKNYIKKRYGIKNNKIFVFPNAIDTDLFKPSLKTDFDPKKTVDFLFIGRLNSQKNIINLLKAFVGMENYTLTIIGKGELENKMNSVIEANKMPVKIIHSVKNNLLPEFFRKSDIYIQPSLFEGNPKTILEAMSCGLPVIATNVVGINNIINHKVNGWLCEIDWRSIKNSVLELISNPEMMKPIGNNARKFIEGNYALGKIIKKEIEIYDK